ncbi:MAG TPA: class I SAM-dependent methyltransferase [Myxococcales bacterium]|jgi:SAM-dependent methyltransferase
MRRFPITRLVLAVLLGTALGGCAPSAHSGAGHRGGGGAAARHRFERAEEWAPRFEDPLRDQWQRPDEVIAALALKADARIADIGAATGYFPVRLARALPAAKVWGVDVEPSMVEYLRKRAKDEALGNLEAVLGTPEDPKIAGPVDLVLLVDTYHHLDDRVTYFRRLAPVFAKGGRLAVIDFRPDSKMGPEHKLAPEKVSEELVKAGYALVQDHPFLPEQYFLVFEAVR